VTIADCEIPSGAKAAEVPWSQQGRALAVTMPEILPDTPPYTFRIAPAR
jgi:hypothetical protein